MEIPEFLKITARLLIYIAFFGMLLFAIVINFYKKKEKRRETPKKEAEVVANSEE